MKTTHFSRKLLAGSLSFFLLSSNFSFLGVPLENGWVTEVSAAYVVWTPTSLSSSWTSFTGTSFLNSHTGSFVDTGSLSFDFAFSANTYNYLYYQVDYQWLTGTWDARQIFNSSLSSPVTNLNPFGSFSGNTFVSNYLSGAYTDPSATYTGAYLDFSNLVDGKYKLSLSTGMNGTYLDELIYEFSIDRVSPVISHSGIMNMTESSAELDNLVIQEENFSGATLTYTASGWSSNTINIPVTFSSGMIIVNNGNPLHMGGLLSLTYYDFQIQAYDLAGHATTSTGWFMTTVGGGTGSGTTNYIPGTTFQSPIQTVFSNSWQIAATGSIDFSITNDRPQSLSGVTILSVGLSDKFLLNSPSLTAFTGVLAGNSCSGALVIKKEGTAAVATSMNIIECKLTNPLSVATGAVMKFTMNGVTNPPMPGKYSLGAKLKTALWDEFFYSETLIKDNDDVTPPVVTGIFPMNSYQLLLEFNEPIHVDSMNNFITGSFSPDLSLYSSYADYNNPRKLFLSTSEQTGATAYSFNITGIKDFNGNTATATGNYTSYDPTAKDLNYISPYMLSQGKTYTEVFLYGKNDIFSGVSVGQINIGSLSGMTFSSIAVDDANKIHFQAVISNGATLGNRDLSVTVDGTNYKLFNAFMIDKNWDNLVFWQNVSPTNYNVGAKTGQLKVEFSEDITSIGDLSVEKNYGTTTLMPAITSPASSGNILTLTLTGVESGNGYDLSFSGIAFSGGKVLNDNNNKVFFSFFDGNYANQILPPIVNYSFPSNFAFDVPIKDPTASGFVMKVGFDQPLDPITVTSANIKLKNASDNEVTTTLSYTGTELTLSTDTPLVYGSKYTLLLSSGVKSDKWLNLVGNIPTSEWGGHSIAFNTMSDYSNVSPAAIGFFVEKTDPFFQALDVPYDAKMRVIFNEVIDKATVNGGTVKLYDISGTNPVQKTVSFTYDNDYTPKTLYVNGGTLSQNTKYRLVITGSGSGVKSVKNQTLNVPSGGHIVEFKTGTGNAASVPLNIMWDYKMLDNTSFEVGFSSPIDASTVNVSSVALYQSGGTKVVSSVNYNHFSNAIKIEPSVALLDNTDYKIVLDATTIKDIGWNNISTGVLTNGFVYNSTNATVEKSYSTAGSVITPFFIDSFWATPTKVEVKFSKPISDALNKANYTISYCNAAGTAACTPDTSVSLTNATIQYNDIERRVSVEGLSIPPSTASTQTVVAIDLSNVRDKFSNSLTVTTQQAVLFSADVGTSYQGNTQAIELKANINPQNNTAGKKALYFIDFPVSTKLVTGSKIEVSFPSQFDLTSLRFDSGSYVNYVNGDKTKPKFGITKLSDKNILEYTITADYAATLRDNDYITSDIQDVVNPIQAKDYTTDGYTTEITMKNTLWVVLSKIQSNPIFIKESPTGSSLRSITLHLQDKNGITLSGASISGAVVGFNTPSGFEELLSDSDGTIVYTGELNKNYSLFLSPEIKLKDTGDNTYSVSNYIATNNQFVNIFLDADKTVDVILKDKNDATEFVTLSGSITGLSGKELTIWVSSPNGFFNKDLGIVGSPASYELKVPKNAGYTTVGISPTMAPAGTAANYKAPDFMPPKPLNVDVGIANISNLNFAIEAATIDFTVVVKDNSGSGKVIPKANVYAYSPSGDSMGLYGQTDAMGQVKFKTKAGVYTYGAYIEGLPAPLEQTITIGTSGSYTGNLVVAMPNRTIEGKLLNGNDPISGMNISAYNQGKWAYLNTMTDASGNYKFYVEDGIWKLGGWVQTYGSLEEKTLTVSGDSLTNQNFVITQVGVYAMTGSVNLSATSGTGVPNVNIFAESTDNDYTKNFFAFSDDTGAFKLSLKDGTYKIHAYHPQYGEIGVRNATVNGVAGSVGSFVIASQKRVVITMTGAGLPDDLSKFEWMVNVFDNTNKKGSSKKIKSLTGYTFENVAAGTYDVKINVTGIGQVFSSGSFVVDGDKTLDIELQGADQSVNLGGTVYVTGTTTPLQDAYVELRNTLTKQSFGTKTNASGVFDIKLKKGMNYELTAKKPGYGNSNIFTGTVASTGTALGNIYLTTLSSTINISGTVVGSGSLDSKKAFLSLQGANANGSDTSKWFGQEITISGSTFTLSWVPANFGTGKLIFATEGYEMKSDTLRNYGSSHVTGIAFSLTPLQVSVPKTLPITPSQGGVLSDNDAGMKVTFPSNALGTSTDPGTITAKETSVIPNTPGGEPVGGKAKQITATDANGQPITSLNSDVTIELTYSGSELTATDSWITLDEVKNMQISYYDATAESWISLPTIVSSSSGTLFETHSGSVLLSSLNPENILFTLKTETDHFTLFTALISTVVANSIAVSVPVTPSTPAPSSGGGGGSTTTPVSLATALTTTFNSISKYLGDTTQSIVLKSGANINTVLSIKRDGKTIALTDLLKTSATTISSVSKNLVSFAVGDIISTSKDGSLEIALDGYSKMQLSPGSSMKIAEVGNGFLSYENMGGNVQYQFDKRDGGKFEYKVKGKTGYATIRGTTLEVSSNSTKDTYTLIEGKIDIYNSILKKTVSLIAGDTYTVYASGKEDLTKMESLKVATTSTNVTPVVVVPVLAPCGPYKDVDAKSEFCPYITKLNQKGIARTNATYEPNRSISRAELLKMANLSRGTTPIFNKLYTYLDIKTSDWWAPYVSTAKRLGFISATNVNFEPNRPITRAEAMKIIMNFSGVKIGFDTKYSYGDVKSTDWSAPYISTAKKSGFISATQTKFRPNDSISRAEVAKILFNIFFK